MFHPCNKTSAPTRGECSLTSLADRQSYKSLNSMSGSWTHHKTRDRTEKGAWWLLNTDQTSWSGGTSSRSYKNQIAFWYLLVCTLTEKDLRHLTQQDYDNYGNRILSYIKYYRFIFQLIKQGSNNLRRGQILEAFWQVNVLPLLRNRVHKAIRGSSRAGLR